MMIKLFQTKLGKNMENIFAANHSNFYRCWTGEEQNKKRVHSLFCSGQVKILQDLNKKDRYKTNSLKVTK